MINLNLRHKRQALFQMPTDRFKSLSFDAKSWSVYDNANFSIHITDKCNADCAFCIAHLRYLNDGNTYVKPELESFDKYLATLDKALKAVSAVSPSISITGGEPTVSPKIGQIIDVLIANNVRKKTITTNASGLHYKLDGGKTVFEKLVDYELDYLNISRAHWDEDKNALLMTMNKKLASNGFLKEIFQEARKAGLKTRLSCALLKDGVNSLETILKYTQWAQEIGADAVIFRQLMKFNESKVLPGRIPIFCKEQELDLVPLWEEMDASKKFILQHQVLGYYYYVEVRTFDGFPVVTESADLNLIPVQLDRFSTQLKAPVAFELVYHPNGNLCAGWNENELVMLESF